MNKERAGEEKRTEETGQKAKQSKTQQQQKKKTTKKTFYLYSVIFKFPNKDILLKGL